MLAKFKHRHLLILLLIWLAGVVVDRIWFACDRSVPDWDRAEYLTSSLNYWQALQQPQWFSSDWWTDFWQLSTKAPPLAQIAAAVTQLMFGTGSDRATLVNLFFSAILLVSVYGLGLQLFSAEVGLWAAGICQLIPGLYKLRLDFLLDYPLTAVVTLCFWCLTVWRMRGQGKIQYGRGAQLCAPTPKIIPNWFWAIAFGISLGMALLVKQTALFFLLTPVVWTGVEVIRKRNIGRICQFAIALLLSAIVFMPWYRTNWLLILTGGKRATVDSAIAEGDPALNTLDAWTYYWKLLPEHISWVLLLVPIVGLLLYKSQKLKVKSQNNTPDSLIWLAIFLIGAYLLCSLNLNKDSRYVVPYLPGVALLLAYGMTCWRGRWGQQIRWSTVGLTVLVMGLNLFPLGGILGSRFASSLSPNAKHYAYMGSEYPHAQVIEEIVQTAPNLISNLGVLPSTLEVNQHNLNYFGALRNFQVYGRQVGTRQQQIVQDGRSLDWFVTKTGEQGSVPNAQTAMVQYVEQSPDFNLQKTWTLPDSSSLKLYHRRVPQVEVGSRGRKLGEQLPITNYQLPTTNIKLSRVTVPSVAPPGKPIPVTYEWSGTWEQLQPGIVLLTWKNRDSDKQSDRWIHDRAIGMGNLIHNFPTPVRAGFEPGSLALTDALSLNPPLLTSYTVTERSAMMPPSDLSAGIYTLEATYLNRNTGETYPITVPPVNLKINPAATATPAPELDLVTQERLLAATLPQGIKALDRVFAEVGRINQYDPIQDYLVQVQLAMEYRLKQEPQNIDWAYALTLAQILQQNVKGAIAALERVTQLDSQNPYAYAYLAFVHLYNWNGAAAQTALKPALALNSNIPELHALHGIAALMQGNLMQAWQDYSTFRE
ncbi:phospholipid carrier-dependent glycosyltransferase [Scytonema millei]|uniref:Phospholipid carrier-dependent glycosyltransferase n=1 Tax=Scytonema millei VB511283 TaxID=1245923 RepID=A0A9X5E1I6_9CYAN|nr:phospholipid carrier-dependent glycosyltransferase [Scytonema millei]NHC33680.1 phospholipid carrier-dependent glycosyltransferase [Scytonema millei VB511283]